MTNFRYAIWCAVSTETQAAADRISLDVQETKCRETANGRGWQETAGPYIVKGESRTRYVNLRDAELEIPELAALLNDAQAGRYDLAVMYDYNRLRDLLAPVSKVLSSYNVQIFSLNQPVEPIDPRRYTPYASDKLVEGLAQILSQAQISDLRRKHAAAMPRRVTGRGLHPNNLPYGYAKPQGSEIDHNAVAVQVTDKCALVTRMKDMYLAGSPVKDIATVAQASGLPSPGGSIWSEHAVKRILVNPFYAGIVRYGLFHRRVDPRTGKQRRVINERQMVTGEGKHDPLWDVNTYQAILAEHDSRSIAYVRHRNRPLTSLLLCSVCNRRMWIDYHGRDTWAHAVWICSGDRSHPHYRNDLVVPRFAAQLAADIRADIDKEPEPISPNPDAARLSDLQAQRARLEDGYQAGALSLQAFLDRTSGLDTEISRLQMVVNGETNAAASLKAKNELKRSLALYADGLPDYLVNGDGLEINHLLRMLIKSVVVTDESIKIEYR